MTDQDPTPAVAREHIGRLVDQIGRMPDPTPEERAARETRAEERVRQMIAEGRRADSLARFGASCPREFLESNWDHPEIQGYRQQIDRVLGWQGPRGILASGPTGRRKSGSMWALMRRLCEEGHDVRFYSAHDFFGQLQGEVRYGHDDARGWIEAVAHRGIVFIDDYGQQALLKTREDWAQGWFFRFLDIRAGLHLPLFVTTNMTADDIAGRGNLRGDPLIRRLLMVCDPVPFETDDERRARAGK